MVRKTVVPSSRRRPDLVPHPGAGLRVEPGRRLVEEQHLRAMDDAEPDVEPAAHAARIGAGRPVGGGLEIERREHLGRAGLARRGLFMPYSRPWMTSSPRPVSAGIGRAALRDVADPPADLLRLAPQVDAGDRRLARRRREQRREHPQRRRLAGAVRPEEAEDLARADLEVDAADGLDRPPLRVLNVRAQVAASRSSSRGSGGCRHVDAPARARMLSAALLARFSNMGHYLRSADSYPAQEQMSTMTRDNIDSVLRALRRVNFQGSFFGQTVAIRFGLSESDVETLELLDRHAAPRRPAGCPS